MKIRHAILASGCLVLVCASLSQAQQKGQINASVIPDAEVISPDVIPAPTLAITGEPSAAPAAPVPSPPQGGGAIDRTSQDDTWHLSVSPYLWLPWIHGTVGALGNDAGFSVTPSDLLSHARFGLLGAVEARRNRLLTTVDLLYMRLGDDKALPVLPPPLIATSANLTANIFILTPKVGIRLINSKKIAVDFLTGIRYWYFGESLNFSPSTLNLNFSKSQNWVDPLVGGRIEAALSQKTVFTVAGDVGGWGTGSQLEYQVVGLLGYKLKPNMTLQAGYRYLYFDYQKGGPAAVTTNLALSGIVLGVTLNLK
jgi:hypothetical protein